MARRSDARARASATAGWRTSSAPRSWKPIVLGSSARTSAPKPIGANLRRRRLRETAMSHTHATPQQQLPAPAAGLATMRQIFYGLINLAKRVNRPCRRRSSKSQCSSRVSPANRRFGRNHWQIIVNYIAIAPAQYCRSYLSPTGPHVSIFSPCRRQAMLLAGLCVAALMLVAHRAPPAERAKSPAVDGARQHVARLEHVRRAGPHHSAQPALSRNVQAVARHREAGLHAAGVDPASQGHRIVFRRRRPPIAEKSWTAFAAGDSSQHYVQASDGRIVLAKNEPLPDGGWVSTHEDVTEQRSAEAERAAIREQEQRRAVDRRGDRHVPPAGGETSVQRERQRDRHALDRGRAARLVRSDLATRRKRRACFQRGFRQRGDRGGRGRRIVALDRRDQPPAHPHQQRGRAWRPTRRAPPTTRSPGLPTARRRSAT